MWLFWYSTCSVWCTVDSKKSNNPFLFMIDILVSINKISRECDSIDQCLLQRTFWIDLKNLNPLKIYWYSKTATAATQETPTINSNQPTFYQIIYENLSINCYVRTSDSEVHIRTIYPMQNDSELCLSSTNDVVP